MPDTLAERFGGESVEQILGVLASSLLAVATFSLGAMVTAYTSISQAATPRAAILVTSDRATQRSLATFVGAFLYAVVGLTAINAGLYGSHGRAIIFGFSLLVVGLVAFQLLAWINRLSSLARVGHVLVLIEERAKDALKSERRRPRLGGVAGDLPAGAPIPASRTGHVQNIDISGLKAWIRDTGRKVQVLAAPGDFVRRGEALARIDGAVETEQLTSLTANFSIGRSRTFAHDPRQGLAILGEAAAKALSPGVNDPGTAIEAMGAGVRLIDGWARSEIEPEADPEPRLMAPALMADALVEAVFGPVARHGSDNVLVAERLQRALSSLEALGGEVGAAAAVLRRESRRRALEQLAFAPDRRRLRAASD